MSLTEDRWVQIPSKLILILFFSVIQLRGMNVIPDLDTGHTVMIPLKFLRSRRRSRQIFSFTAIHLYCCRSGQLLHRVVFDTLWAACVSNLSSAEFLSRHKIFSLFPSYLILQRAHFLSVCVRVSWADTHQYCVGPLICTTLLIFPAAFMETVILLPRLAVSGFTQKYVRKWIRQNKYVQLDYIINSVYCLVFCLSAQGTHPQRSGGAPGGSSWGRHLHAWGHPEGECHVQLQADICLISALAPEQTPHGPESCSVWGEEFLFFSTTGY